MASYLPCHAYHLEHNDSFAIVLSGASAVCSSVSLLPG
jgi:hypothetical protein